MKKTIIYIKKTMRERKEIFMLLEIIVIFSLIRQVCKAVSIHWEEGIYDSKSWELVWPVIVSTMIAIFGTLITSYVFLKDTLDRTIDEKPYYGNVIVAYRQEKIRTLSWYSAIFVGISCYLMLFQGIGGGEGENYNIFMYLGIVVAIVLLVSSLLFLYQCINIDYYIYVSAQSKLEELNKEMKCEWRNMGRWWRDFIDCYIEARESGNGILRFLEIGKVEQGDIKNCEKNQIEFDEEKFIIKFSEWEKFILAFLDKSSGQQNGRDIDTRIMLTAEIVKNFEMIQKVEYEDAKANSWEKCAYVNTRRYDVKANCLSINDFLNIYRLLSEYRDALQVKLDKKAFADIVFNSENKENIMHIPYMLFLLRFYSSLRCLVTLPKIDISYPSVKMYNADFYNVRFENTSFRAAAFEETIFARSNMVGSNLALAKFVKCNFYNADIRDCSLENALFKECLMTDMICSDVDVTGTIFEKVDLKESTFENAVLVNVEFQESTFDYVNFINCKLGQVIFRNIMKGEIKHSSFKQSIIKNMNFYTDKVAIKIIDNYSGCNRNYFKELKIEVDEKGKKKREESDIWEGLEKDACSNLNMSFASFVEVMAERINFQNMMLDSSIFTRANMQKSIWENVCMKGCVMSSANLTEAELKNINMESCAMPEAVLYKSKFNLVNLQDSNLSDCHASESKWKCCMFDKSDMSRIDLTKSEVTFSSFRDTIFTEAELTYAYFYDDIFENMNGKGILSSYSYFESCNFTNAFLAASNFNYTVFINCDLSLASMAGSTIEEAGFEECNFENGNFRDCCFIQVTFKNNINVSREIFEGCIFINCLFEGNDKIWESVFRSEPVHFKVK